MANNLPPIAIGAGALLVVAAVVSARGARASSFNVSGPSQSVLNYSRDIYQSRLNYQLGMAQTDASLQSQLATIRATRENNVLQAENQKLQYQYAYDLGKLDITTNADIQRRAQDYGNQVANRNLDLAAQKQQSDASLQAQQQFNQAMAQRGQQSNDFLGSILGFLGRLIGL